MLGWVPVSDAELHPDPLSYFFCAPPWLPGFLIFPFGMFGFLQPAPVTLLLNCPGPTGASMRSVSGSVCLSSQSLACDWQGSRHLKSQVLPLLLGPG